ncbi:radial spoke head protein 6 homolog A [Atheta coriaria]|uniref:radial spoke head protein 6 homolog A n=1 Tax=Dalotia coriaria TaxID=877792 RepID=UPI0031F3461B
MLQDYDDFNHPPEDDSLKPIVPDADNEFVRAKTFLQTGSTLTGDNLYDHLTDVLNKILAERPENVIDFFEEYSRKVKEKRFRPLTDHLEDIYVHPPRYKLCKKWQPLLMPLQPDEPSTMDPEDMEIADMTHNNMLLLLYYFEQAGVGLPRSEMFAIMMSMMRFVKSEPVASVRFWGKIYGDYKNYLVLETELKDEELVKRHESTESKREEELKMKEEAETAAQMVKEEQSRIDQIQEIQGEESTSSRMFRPLPPLPVNHYEEPPEIPMEPPGVGVNKKVYYVCNEAGDEWIQLPDVTPQQIKAARLIRKTITGNLEQSLCTYPEFPGVEMNYLRAQIARISAGSQISPLGYYTFSEEEGEGVDEEEEEEEDESEQELHPKGTPMKTDFTENSRFDGLPLNDLLDPSMAFWVHHSQYILPQGRTTWWNPNPDGELPGEEEQGEGEEEDEGDRDKPRGNMAEPETGPPLLTSLGEDSSLDAVAPWSVRTSSNINPTMAISIVRSNIWPGAFCFATQGKLFENIYLGDGQKYVSHNYTPQPLPPVQQDYPIGPEIMEIDDPTGAEEEAWRIAHLPPEKPVKEELGEGEGEGEEDEDEEDEDEEEDDEED